MKRLSWKTTVFSCIAASGAAIIGAERTGLIDGSKMPDWFNAVANLMMVIGTACTGVFARDNNVSSEESGAKAKQAEIETSFLVKHPGAEIPHPVVPPSEKVLPAIVIESKVP